MIETPSILEELQRRKISVTLAGADKLHIDAPPGTLTPDITERIRANKGALLALLTPSPSVTPAPAPASEQASSSRVERKPGHTEQGAPSYRAIENAEPPRRCLRCGYMSRDGWKLNPSFNRWQCPKCQIPGMLNHARVIVDETGQDAITEAVAFLDDIKARGCFIRYYESGKCGLTVPAEWNHAQFTELADAVALRDEILRRLIPARPGAPVEYIPEEKPAPEPETEQLPRVTPAPAPEQEPEEQEEQEESPRQWVTLFADIQAGRAITERGETLTFPPDSSLSGFLAEITKVTPVSRVFLCGARPGGDTAEGFISWLTDADMMEEYQTDKRGHSFDSIKPDSSVARYVHRISRQKIDIRRITSWLGDDRESEQEAPLYTIEDARAAMLLVTRYLRGTFPFFKHLSGTPSSTFTRLWVEGNRIAGKRFTPLANEIRGLIHRNAGQGRIEFFTEHSKGKLPLFYYDGIFMYAALTWGLPTEVAAHDTINEYAGKVPARYRIRYTVPASWQHVGLFMTKRDGADWREKDGWFYPGAAEAGLTFETWVDGAELDIAYNLPENMPKWDITILERIVFKAEKEASETKPLETITRKLVSIREQIDADKRQDAKHERAYALARGAVRNILLHGIGSFNRERKTRAYLQLKSEPAPAGWNRDTAIDHIDIDNAREIYIMRETDDTNLLAFPQWAALIWARCRARMTKAALALPYESIIAIRTDAIAVSAPVPAFEANRNATKPGLIRRKWAIEKPIAAPATTEALDAIQRKVTRK